jgi:protein O-GlcNAc transferase
MTDLVANDAAILRFIDTTTKKAMLLYTSGYIDQAIALFTDLLSLFPANDDVRIRLARLHVIAGHVDEVLFLLQGITEQSSFFSAALMMKGVILSDRRELAEGAECFSRVLKLNDRNVDAHNNLALCLMDLAKPEEAQEHFAAAIELAPDNAEIYNNFGNLLVRYWKLAEAAFLYRKAIEINQDFSGAYCNLGRIANFEGRSDDAIAIYTKVLDMQPEFITAADNMLFIFSNSDRFTPEQVSNEHIRLSHIYPVSTEKRPELNYHKNRKIRVGYVSPDFKSHSVGFFIEPVLKSHRKDNFEIFCYAQVPTPDETTSRMQNFGWTWRSTIGLPDRYVADQIRADAIDILVDLAGHSSDNRLGVFALQPAPIQVTWIGYPNTTGLKQIDYRLTDEHADPTGTTEHLYSEKLMRLPRSFLCYSPPPTAPEIAALPGEPVIFCCFNHNPKISDTILRLWAKILHAVPGSKISLKSGPLGDSGVRTRLTERFASLKIDQSRLILNGFTINREDHLQRYGDCHIALDTYPYNGTTTTCEALWMGVPVITLAGVSHASRVGMSILKNIGLQELVAESSDAYITCAVELARNTERIRRYRHTLRSRMQSSVLMDTSGFISDLEEAFMSMLWEQSEHEETYLEKRGKADKHG